MKPRQYTLVGIIMLALVLVSGIFTILKVQAGENPPPIQFQNNGALPPEDDLAVTQVDILTITNTRLDYRFTIENLGPTTIPMENIYLQSILSENTIYGDGTDRATGGYAMSPYLSELESGEAFTLTYIANPANVNFYDYNYFMIMIDSNYSLDEFDEDNNVGYASLPEGPDLIVPTVNVLSINNDGVVYQFVVKNIGDGGADLDGPDDENDFDNINFQGLLSINDIPWDGDDVAAGGGFLQSPPIPSDLFPGEVFTYTMSAGMLGSNFLDYHYVFVHINLAENIPETDYSEESNIGKGEIPYFIFLPMILQP